MCDAPTCMSHAHVPCERYLDGECAYREAYSDAEEEALAVRNKHAACPFNHNDASLFPIFGVGDGERNVYKARRLAGRPLLLNLGRAVVRRDVSNLPLPRSSTAALVRGGSPLTSLASSSSQSCVLKRIPCSNLLAKGYCIFYDRSPLSPLNECEYNHDIANLSQFFPESLGLKLAMQQACHQHFFNGNRCQLGNSCPFSHSAEDVKSVKCARFLHGVCPLGDDGCPMAHDTVERAVLREGEGDNQCAFCSELTDEDGTDAVRLRCDHRFHSKCFDDWARRKKECPLCRAPTD